MKENIRRTDLTEAERSVKTVEMAETAKAVAEEEEEELRPTMRHNSGMASTEETEQLRLESRQKMPADVISIPKRGRPAGTMPGSYRDIEERTGIDKDTIRLAEKHVAALEAHPEVREAPQALALAYVRTL